MIGLNSYRLMNQNSRYLIKIVEFTSNIQQKKRCFQDVLLDLWIRCGFINLFECFSVAGLGDLVRINGIMEKKYYRHILETNAISSGRCLIGTGFICTQNNDPKNRLCRSYTMNKENCGNLKYMAWLSQLPNLKQIELLWDKLDRDVRKKCPTSYENLWNALRESGNTILPETIQNLLARKVIRSGAYFLMKIKFNLFYFHITTYTSCICK